jgi:Flp pilus assembly protein TadD
MRAALAILPEYAEAHLMLGTALKQNGDLEGAEAALRQAVRLAPDDPGPWNTLAQVLRARGDEAGSRAAFAAGAKAKQKKETELGRMLQKK